MSKGLPRVYRLNPKTKYAGIVFGIGLMLFGGALGLSALRYMDLPPQGGAFFVFVKVGFVTFFFAFGGLGILGIIKGIRVWNDAEPKLTVTQEKLIDHRAKDGVTHIRWADVASVDGKIWSSGDGGKLVVYVRDLAEVRTQEVDLSGLDHRAEDIFIEIKKHLLLPAHASPPPHIEIIQDLRGTEIAAGEPGLPRSRPGEKGTS